jgi:hypothetical protein
MYSIWTRDTFVPNKLTHMIGGFSSIHEAMVWLTETYQSNAEFWVYIREIKVLLD